MQRPEMTHLAGLAGARRACRMPIGKTGMKSAPTVAKWAALFEQVDVIFCPVSPTPATAHDHWLTLPPAK